MLILKNVNFLAIFATFSILQKVTKNGEKGKGVSLTSNNRALFYYFYPFFIFEKGAKNVKKVRLISLFVPFWLLFHF
jgi:hypothetical protein